MCEKFPCGTSSVVAAKVANSSRSLSNKEEQTFQKESTSCPCYYSLLDVLKRSPGPGCLVVHMGISKGLRVFPGHHQVRPFVLFFLSFSPSPSRISGVSSLCQSPKGRLMTVPQQMLRPQGWQGGYSCWEHVPYSRTTT